MLVQRDHEPWGHRAGSPSCSPPAAVTSQPGRARHFDPSILVAAIAGDTAPAPLIRAAPWVLHLLSEAVVEEKATASNTFLLPADPKVPEQAEGQRHGSASRRGWIAAGAAPAT